MVTKREQILLSLLKKTRLDADKVAASYGEIPSVTTPVLPMPDPDEMYNLAVMCEENQPDAETIQEINDLTHDRLRSVLSAKKPVGSIRIVHRGKSHA